MTDATHDDATRFHGVHVLADDHPRWNADPVEQARAACAGGASVVQLRAKHTADRQLLTFARAIREATREAGATFVVNDRFDLALAAGADAVHLGQEDLPPDALPSEARERLAVGRSTHTPLQARSAAHEPIDYAAIGPVYGTTSKTSSYDDRGLDVVTEVAAIVAPRPLVAIGGITLARIPELVEAGVHGVAVISAVAGSSDPEAAVRSLCRAFREATLAAHEKSMSDPR